MTSRWFTALLVISVSLNLLFIGVVAGRIISVGGPHRTPGDPTLGYFRGLRALPDERMALIRPVVMRHFRAMQPNLRKIRPAQKNLLDSLTATPFDAEALTRALEQLRLLLASTQIESHASLVEVATKLSDAERRQLAEYMRRPGHARPGHPPPGSQLPHTRMHKPPAGPPE